MSWMIVIGGAIIGPRGIETIGIQQRAHKMTIATRGQGVGIDPPDSQQSTQVYKLFLYDI